jgi:hypothetical protein
MGSRRGDDSPLVLRDTGSEDNLRTGLEIHIGYGDVCDARAKRQLRDTTISRLLSFRFAQAVSSLD